MTADNAGLTKDTVDTRRKRSRAWRRNLGLAVLAIIVPIGVLATYSSSFLSFTGWTEHLSHGLTHRAHASDVFYTCPMHPTIVEEAPGTCPICGMELVEKKEAVNGAATDETVAKGSTGRKIKYWAGPMDPTYISDKPGKSPMGMDLVPVYEEEGAPSDAGVIRVDPVMVQNMGVRIAPVERGAISRHVRTIGEVEVAEDEVSVVNLRFSGWVERIWVDETGQKVQQGQKLFSIYSPELVSAQEEYLLAVNTSGKDSPLTRAAARRLKLWEIPQYQLDSILKDGNAHRKMVISSPASGYVLHKALVQGARVQAGADLYRIGNLQKIWVNAEVYEFDAPWIRVGQSATMELSFQQGRQWEGQVSYVYPTLNKRSRTLTVRLEFPNPGIEFKPGMFATVRIEAQRRDDVLILPTEAIIHSGKRHLVYVALKVGRYAPREIVMGLVGDGHKTEVLSGLEDGEHVVTSGQFLLDSESQLQAAVQKLLDARLQAKRARGEGGDAGSGDTGQEKPIADTYWTCSMHPSVVQEGPGTCPMCGMNLVEKRR